MATPSLFFFLSLHLYLYLHKESSSSYIYILKNYYKCHYRADKEWNEHFRRYSLQTKSLGYSSDAVDNSEETNTSSSLYREDNYVRVSQTSSDDCINHSNSTGNSNSNSEIDSKSNNSVTIRNEETMGSKEGKAVDISTKVTLVTKSR